MTPIFRLGFTGSVFVFLTLVVFTSAAMGAGFALMNQGTAAMAQGNAFVAEASDASAIFYNPAGLTQLKRPQFYLGAFLIHPDREYEGNGTSAQTNHRLYRAASVYFSLPVHSRVVLGLGVFAPFGLGTAWPPDWVGRYLTTWSSMKTYNLNPVVAVKVLDSLSLAAGFDVLWSAVRLKRQVSPLLPGVESDLGGVGTGFGYNLAALYEPVAGVKLGVNFRSEISVKHKGNLNMIPAVVPRTNGSANLTFPPTVTFGIAYARLKPFTFEFDATWTGWSTYDELRVDFAQPVLGATSSVTPKNWKDVWAFRFGANWEVREGLKLRAGYIYDLNPVPDDTFDPMLPDADRHIFTVGLDYKIRRFTLGVAYNYILLEGRSKNNTIGILPATFQANGSYESDVHCLGLSMNFQF